MHDLAPVRDIFATFATKWGCDRATAKVKLRAMEAHGLLGTRYVQTDSKPRTVVGVPPAIKTIDAFVGELAGVDPGGVTPAQLLTDNAIASVLPGEVALAIDIVSLAIEAADGPVDSENRRDARSWLQDNSRIYSARLCFEVLGFKYDAVRKLLIQRWMKEQP